MGLGAKNQKISDSLTQPSGSQKRTVVKLEFVTRMGIDEIVRAAGSLYFALSEVRWRSRWVFRWSNVSGLAIIKYVITTVVYNGLDCGRLVVPGGHEWSKVVCRWHRSDFTYHINIIRHSLSEYWNSKFAKNCHLETLMATMLNFCNF